MARKVYRRGRDGASPVSEQNSTTELLAAGEKFVGVSDDINDYASVAVTAFANTSSATCGLILECSLDDVRWAEMAKLTVPGGAMFTHRVNLSARYFRLSYLTEGPQTEFTLQTIYYENPTSTATASEPSAVRLSNGDSFVDLASYHMIISEMNQAIESMLTQQRLTNLYLAKLADETYFAHDIEEE